ncbi:MAG: hypothetical protein ACOYT7_01225 [Patescibacteria group bacterium]
MSREQKTDGQLSGYRLLPDGRVQKVPSEDDAEKRKREIVEGVQYLEKNVRPLLEKINAILLGGRGEIFTTDFENLTTDSEPIIKLQWRKPYQSGPTVLAHTIRIQYINDPNDIRIWSREESMYPRGLIFPGSPEGPTKAIRLKRRGWGETTDIITEGHIRVEDIGQTRAIATDDWESQLLSVILLDMQVEPDSEPYEGTKNLKTALDSLIKEKELREKDRKETRGMVDQEDLRNEITAVLFELNKLAFNGEAQILPWVEEENTHGHWIGGGFSMDSGFIESSPISHTVNAYVIKVAFPKIDKKMVLFMVKSEQGGLVPEIFGENVVYGFFTDKKSNPSLCPYGHVVFRYKYPEINWKERLRAKITDSAVFIYAKTILGSV